MVQIIADSSTLYTIDEAQKAGFESVPLCVTIGDLEGRDLQVDMKDFYGRIRQGQIPMSSQPPIGDVVDMFEKYPDDEIINISMADGLSGTYQSATIAADGLENKIHVIDTTAVSLGQRILLEYGLSLSKFGASATEIADELERKKQDIRIFGAVETLEYLIKGGRLSKAAGTIGSVLGIRPVLYLSEGGLAVAGKARGVKAAITMTHNLIAEVGVDYSMPYAVGYTGNNAEVVEPFLNAANSAWYGQSVPAFQVGSTVGSHTGPGLFLAAFFQKS